MSKALEITNENFDQEVLRSDVPVLVDFWAPWCMPCQMMAPILDEVSGEWEGKIKIAKVDVEDPLNQEIAIKYGIQSIPNMKIFRDGKVVDEILGFMPKEVFMAQVQSKLGL